MQAPREASATLLSVRACDPLSTATWLSSHGDGRKCWPEESQSCGHSRRVFHGTGTARPLASAMPHFTVLALLTQLTRSQSASAQRQERGLPSAIAGHLIQVSRHGEDNGPESQQGPRLGCGAQAGTAPPRLRGVVGLLLVTKRLIEMKQAAVCCWHIKYAVRYADSCSS